MRLGRSSTAVCLALLLVGVSIRLVHAQAILEGKVAGTVLTEDGMPVPGTTVEISSPALLGGARSTTTSARGTYVFLSLPPGAYRLTASRDAFKTVVREDIAVSAGTVVSIDVTLPVGGLAETVTVTAESSIVDTKTSAIDSRIDRHMLDKLPTRRDAFYDLSLTAPGMFDSQDLPSPTAYGSATNENVFLIDGVDATNPRAASFGSLVSVNYDAVEEVRIVALGAKAEYGSYSGAAIDVRTRSGANDLHGSASFYSLLGSPADNQPPAGADLGADWLYVGEGEQLSGDVKKDWEAALTLGGPILRDKLWFFGALDYRRGTSLRPRWSLENESWGRLADARISAAPFTNHRAFVSYHYENNDGTGWSWGLEPEWDTTMTYGNASVNHTISGEWQWFPSGATSATAKYLGFRTDDQPHLPGDAPDHPGYINWWKWTQYGINGAFPYVEAQKSSRQTLQADLSHFAEGFLGRHDIKFGVQYTRGRGDLQGGFFQNYANFLYPYRWTQSVPYMQSWYGDDGLLFYNLRHTVNPTLTVRTANSLGLFLDEQWTPTRRLTVNLGVRYDHMTTRYGKGAVYDFVSSPEEVNDPPPLLRDRASTDNVFDFKTFSPRIGLSYMLTGDGKTVARASYGRYHMPLCVEFLGPNGPDMPLTTVTWQIFESGPWSAVDTDGNGYIDAVETRDAARLVHGRTPIGGGEWTFDPSWTLNVADDVKDQRTDQITLNLEREIIPDLSVSATYVYKHAAHIIANVPLNRATGQEWEYERIPFTTSGGETLQLYSIVLQDYNGDGVVDGSDVQWISDNMDHRVENMSAYDGVEPKRDYHGLQLVLKKRYSNRWQGMASLLYSSSDGVARRSAGQDINVQGPMFFNTSWMGSLNDTINNLEGPLPFTPRWEVKLSGSYTIPGLEIDLGARVRYQSGRPIWRIESYPQRTPWSDPPGGIIGGLLVVAGGPDYLPSQTYLDLHLERAFTLGAQKTIHLVIDGFNLFNSYRPTDIDVAWEWGKVTAIPSPRRFRGGLRFEF